MRNPFRRKALNASPGAVEALRGGLNPIQSLGGAQALGGGATQRIIDTYQTAKSANYAWMYQNSPAVRTVIDLIVRNVGQLDLRLYEEVNESERQPRPDHPAALSLRYPSDTVTSDQFIREMFKDFLLADDAVAVMMPGPAGRIAFKWVPISLVQFLGSNMFDTEVYRIWPLSPGSVYQDFQPDNIFHWRGENPQDPRLGLSHLETLRGVVAEDAALQQAMVELAQSGMVEPTWVYRPLDAPVWSNEARAGFEEDLSNRVKRSTRKPVVLEEGMELRNFGVSPQDAEMMQVRKWALSRVAAEFGVPLPLVGLDGDLEQARTEFYADTLPPYCESFTRVLNHRICVRVYSDPSLCFEFNLDEKHMGDDRVTALVSASGRAVMTTNEARAKLNLPPIDTGDDLVTPLNVIVGDNPKPSPQVMGPQDPNGPPQDGSARQEDQPAKALKEAKPPAEDRVNQLVPIRKQEIDRQYGYVDKAQAVVQRHLTRLERSVRNKAQKATVDWDRWDREFGADLHDVIERIVETEGTIYAAKLLGEFDMRRVRNYLKAMAEGAAAGINDKVRQDIAQLGVDDTFANTATHVESAGAGIGVRATLWAREEAARQSPDYEHRPPNENVDS